MRRAVYIRPRYHQVPYCNDASRSNCGRLFRMPSRDSENASFLLRGQAIVTYDRDHFFRGFALRFH